MSTAASELTGYADPAYAESLREFGLPRLLPECGGSILERPIPNWPDRDAIGCYPLFSCRDWSGLGRDIESLMGTLVTVSLVTDPFGNVEPDELKEWFGDRVIPFKEHFVVDLSKPATTHVHGHHRRDAARALRLLEVEPCTDAPGLLDEWHALYGNLIRRHGIQGIAAFSRQSFAKQLRVPGLFALRAVRDGTTVGMTLWYVQGPIVYYHLGAYSDAGYEAGASFALFWSAIEHFSSRGQLWMNLGGGPGFGRREGDGLTRFKRGWATGTRTAYFCGRVLSPDRYAEIVSATPAPPAPADYFPAYRSGELGP
jgi:hypothetical protein